MKTNNYRAMTVLSSVVCLLPLIVSFAVYGELPERIAIQWGLDGNPSNIAHKALVAFGMPLIFTAVNVYSKARFYNDPKRENVSTVMRAVYTWLIPFIALASVPVMLFIAMGANIPVTIIGPLFVGAVFILYGNYLPKSRQNYVVGVKLPWTLNNADNWNKTNRVAGYLWILGGIVFIAGSFVSYASSLWLILAAAVLVLLIIVPFLYSYSLYKRSGGGTGSEY